MRTSLKVATIESVCIIKTKVDVNLDELYSDTKKCFRTNRNLNIVNKMVNIFNILIAMSPETEKLNIIHQTFFSSIIKPNSFDYKNNMKKI